MPEGSSDLSVRVCPPDEIGFQKTSDTHTKRNKHQSNGTKRQIKGGAKTINYGDQKQHICKKNPTQKIKFLVVCHYFYLLLSTFDLHLG